MVVAAKPPCCQNIVWNTKASANASAFLFQTTFLHLWDYSVTNTITGALFLKFTHRRLMLLCLTLGILQNVDSLKCTCVKSCALNMKWPSCFLTDMVRLIIILILYLSWTPMTENTHLYISKTVLNNTLPQSLSASLLKKIRRFFYVMLKFLWWILIVNKKYYYAAWILL